MELYKYEFCYSQSSILADVVFGLLILLAGIGVAFWVRSWSAILLVLAGGVLLWKAVARVRAQLKIGHQGLWTAKTGALKWSRATVQKRLG